MTCIVRGGPRTVGGERDEYGYRTFDISHIVEGDFTDGPANVMQCPTLPQVGDTWSILTGDGDPYCWFTPYMKVAIHQEKEGEKVQYWKVDQKATNKPMKRCNETQIDNPLEEPQKVSGSFVKYTQEVFRDRFGRPIKSSSHEILRGPGVEFDFNRPNVKIEQNVGSLELSLFSGMIDHVNDSDLWGLPKRCVKLSAASWERKLFGVCTYYYTRSFDFDIDANTFDRWLLDEGNKCLYGEWAKNTADMSNGCRIDSSDSGSLWKLLCINGSPPDKNNPQHFIRYKDRNGEMGRCILNGRGEPAALDPGTGTGTTGTAPPGYIYVEYYPETNFLTLGIPTTF